LSDIEPFRQLDALMGKFVPDADIVETDTAFTIRIELAGVSAQDVALELANDVLTLHGEKRAIPRQREATSYLSQRRFGSFDRSFRLPRSVDQGKIEAKMDAGVLAILLPKTTEARQARRKIHIQGS
jgi:HSP20 family protein